MGRVCSGFGSVILPGFWDTPGFQFCMGFQKTSQGPVARQLFGISLMILESGACSFNPIFRLISSTTETQYITTGNYSAFQKKKLVEIYSTKTKNGTYTIQYFLHFNQCSDNNKSLGNIEWQKMKICLLKINKKKSRLLAPVFLYNVVRNVLQFAVLFLFKFNSVYNQSRC